jgi:V8-like Glu-specific endopeptidase
MKFKVTAITLFALIISISPAIAIVNGASAVGSSFVVAILTGEGVPESGCTGAYLKPRVVVTAAHCVIKAGGRAPELTRPIDQFYVSQSGIDLKSPDAKQKRVKVLKIWTEPDYFNRWEPEKNLKETQVNDIAFLFLEKELDGATLTRAATKEEIEDFKLGNQSAFHLGYGMIGGSSGVITANDGKPYLVEGIVGNSGHPSHIPVRDRHMNVTYPSGKSIGPGDSGSPLMLKKGDEILYLGTIYAGGGWNDIAKGDLSVRGVASVTVLWPFISNLDEQWLLFLAEEPKLLETITSRKEAEVKATIVREERISIAKDSGQFYREQTSCHSNNIFAHLQSNKLGDWADVANVEGWISLNDKCHQPWTIYRAVKGESLRWRLEDPAGSWKVFSDPINETTSNREAEIAISQIKAKQEAEEKAAAELLVILEAEKKAAAELAAQKVASVNAAANSKKKLITCVRGKVIKKVTAVKPKCPAGYKKK